MTVPLEKSTGQPTDAFGFEALAVTGTAGGFTAATYDPVGATSNPPAISAQVQCQVAQVRYRVDGTDPTAAIGILLEVGDEIVIWGTQDIKAFSAIRTGGTSATLATTFSR